MKEQWFGYAVHHIMSPMIDQAIGVLLPDLHSQLRDRCAAIFYTRLFDEGPILHLYVKARGFDGEELQSVQARVFEMITPYVDSLSGQVREIRYVPQSARFGGETMMQQVESFFTCSSLIVATSLKAGAQVGEKVALGYWLNARLIEFLELDKELTGAFLQGVEKTWETYYRQHNYPFRHDTELLLMQLRECIGAVTISEFQEDRFADFEDVVQQIKRIAKDLTRTDLLETPVHDDALRMAWSYVQDERAAFAQILIGLMHMNLNKVGIFGELEVAMYRLLAEQILAEGKVS